MSLAGAFSWAGTPTGRIMGDKQTQQEESLLECRPWAPNQDPTAVPKVAFRESECLHLLSGSSSSEEKQQRTAATLAPGPGLLACYQTPGEVQEGTLEPKGGGPTAFPPPHGESLWPGSTAVPSSKSGFR